MTKSSKIKISLIALLVLLVGGSYYLLNGGHIGTLTDEERSYYTLYDVKCYLHSVWGQEGNGEKTSHKEEMDKIARGYGYVDYDNFYKDLDLSGEMFSGIDAKALKGCASDEEKEWLDSFK